MGTSTAFAREQRLGGSHFTAIGAFQNATLAYFDWEKKEYKKNPVREQVEVVSLAGRHRPEREGRAEGSRPRGPRQVGRHALAGHLMEGHVRPTLEVVLTESPSHLRRKHDPQTGLALIDIQEPLR